MALGVCRKDDESWKDCIIRLAGPYDLEQEVIESYDASIARGAGEDDAALEAALEWDVAELLPEDDE
jgi:hypothetical protein